MTRPLRLLAPLALSLATAALACSSAAPSPPAAPRSAAQAAPAAQAGPTGPSGEGLCPTLCSLKPTYAGRNLPRPRLTFHTTSGDEVGDQALRGKIVVLHLWKEPKPDVMEDLPELAKLKKNLGSPDDVAFFSVSIDDMAPRAREAFKELLDNETPYGFVVGKDAQAVASILTPDTLPATWIIDQRGVILARFDGRAPLGEPAMKSLIEGLRKHQGCTLEIDEGKGCSR